MGVRGKGTRGVNLGSKVPIHAHTDGKLRCPGPKMADNYGVIRN